MKHIIVIFITALAVSLASCDNQYENLDKEAGEVVYPATYDTIAARYGFERVELDLWKAGRLPASEMKLGKAVKTVVEYDGKTTTFDSVCSWVNVTGLNQNKLYRIKVYNIDEYNNKSVPLEIAVIPYTQTDKDLLTFAPPRMLFGSRSEVELSWPNNSLNSIIADFFQLSYSYTDATGAIHKDSIKGTNPVIKAVDLAESSQVNFDMTYKVLPRLSDGVTYIIDTLRVEQTLPIQLPLASSQVSLTNAAVIRDNGITDLSYSSLASVQSLILPQHYSDFTDLFYFTSLKKLDLTGYGLPNCLPVLEMTNSRTRSRCGGGAWQPFMRRVEKEQDMQGALKSVDILMRFLESGQLEEVRYIPNSFGKYMDDLLAPYVSSGVVKLVPDDDPIFPDEVYIGPQFFTDGQLVSADWKIDISYSGAFLPRQGLSDIGKFDPNNQVVDGDPIDLHLEQLTYKDTIYKCVVKTKSASFMLSLPKEYLYDSRRYKYFKFKAYCGTKPENIVDNFLRLCPRMSNYEWGSFSGNSKYGQNDWWIDRNTQVINKSNCRTNWQDFVVDTSSGNYYWNDNGNSNRRARVIVFNIGSEPGSVPGKDQVIYIADLRFSKTK